MSPTPATAAETARETAPAAGRARDGGPDAEEAAPTFVLRIGGRTVPVALEGNLRGARMTVDLRGQQLGLAGLRVTEARLRLRNGVPTGGSLHGEVDVPFVTGSAQLDVDADGTLSGRVRGTLAVGMLGDPVVQLRYEAGRMSGSFETSGRDLGLPIPHVDIEEGRAHIRFAGASAEGSVSARFSHKALGRGQVQASLRDGTVSGSGGFELTVPILEGVTGDFDYRDAALTASAELAAADVRVPVPGLTVPSLSGRVELAEGRISGTFGLTAQYAGLATATLEGVSVGPRGFGGGRGTLDVTAPALAGSQGTFVLGQDGKLSGGLRLRSGQIPGVRGGSLTITLREDGGVDVAGGGSVAFGPIGDGDFEAGYADGVLSLGAGVRLQVPPLGTVTGRLDYGPDGLSGRVEVPVTVGPLSGQIIAVYSPEDGWSGSGRLDYRLPRFSGWVLVRMKPEGALSGEGQAEFQLADWLQGTIALVVHPDLNVDATGELRLPDEIELFPRWEMERNFFSFEQEFPLWGITVPVIGSIGIVAEVRASAGFRAGFGPGTFGNIRAVGEVSTRPEAEPQFEISGDLVIPAGAEIVLTVGGGIGLAALVAKISGGVDLTGVAGVYGALTLTPTFAYRDGQYLLEGTALLEAAAQLRASVDAYARIIVGKGWLSKEVWRENWRLAEWRFDPGWTAGLRATVRQVLGEPFQPEVTFDQPEVDPVALVKRAVPRSGEPVTAPAREPDPRAEFQVAEGSAGAVDAGPDNGEMAPGQAPTPEGAGNEPAGAPGTALDETTADGEPRLPRLLPPAGLRTPAEERTLDESWLVYLYDTAAVPLLRRKAATAPGDDELRDRAEQDAGARVPEVPGSSGRPLSPQTRERMEAIFGEDLDDVRVHTDPAAAAATEGLGAEAFTVDHDVYFADTRSPEAGDEELLAHELVHVLQGPGSDTGEASAPEDELEQEAEQAAAAVKRGERPNPVRRRAGAPGVRRAAADDGGEGGGEPVEFTEEEWRKVVSDPELQTQETIRQILAQLVPKERFPGETMAKVYDERAGEFVKNPLPMHWPAADALPTRNVFGAELVTQGAELMRPGGQRESDTNAQNQMVALIRARSRPAASDGQAKPGFFTRSPFGATLEEALEAYTGTDEWQEAKQARTLSDAFVADEEWQTTRRKNNLILTEGEFQRVWQTTPWRYSPRGRVWRRIAEPADVGGAGSDPAAADEAARAQLRNDFEAHHVVPLWLRAVQPRVPDGDQMDNLVPWHRDAHQANHALQQRVPEENRDEARVANITSYLNPNIPDGTRFTIEKITTQGRKQPVAPPDVKLERRSTGATDPETTYMWEAASKPPWMP